MCPCVCVWSTSSTTPVALIRSINKTALSLPLLPPPPPDKDNLFVPSAFHFEIVYLRPDKPAVVPCRVTSPQAKVSLHMEVPPAEISGNGTQVKYDPTRGFVLQSPGPDHQGVFYCKAVTKGTPQISTKFQLLYVEGKALLCASSGYTEHRDRVLK